MENKIKKWLSDVTTNLENGAIGQEIHIEEFYKRKIKKQVKMLEIACDIFWQTSKLIDKSLLKKYELSISIDLIEKSKKILGSPKNITELINNVEIRLNPEIYISAPSVGGYVKSEFYRSSIFYQIYQKFNNDFIVFNDEFRMIEENEDDDEFRRNINIIYFPSKE